MNTNELMFKKEVSFTRINVFVKWPYAPRVLQWPLAEINHSEEHCILLLLKSIFQTKSPQLLY